MEPALKFLLSLPVALYYILESFVLWFVPLRFRYKNVAGQTVLITGAGNGLGRQLAIRFSKLGTRLVLLDIDDDGLKETAALLSNEATGVFLYKCDVSDRKVVYMVAAKIKDEVGFVDILVSNAAVVTAKRFMDCPDERIQKTFEVNTMAHFWLCKAFLPDMKATNKGHLVFMASVAGLGGSPTLTDYSSSKFAVIGFEESLRMELMEEGLHGIKSSVICPYLVNTGFFNELNDALLKPLSPQYVADEIMSAILSEKEVAVIPPSLSFLFTLKALVPRNAARVIYQGSGIIRTTKQLRVHNEDSVSNGTQRKTNGLKVESFIN